MSPRLLAREGALALSTGPRDRFAIATFAPVLGGRFAAFGLANLLVSAAALQGAEETPDGFSVRLAGPGRFAAWCADRPARATLGKRKTLPFQYDPKTHLLSVDVPDVPDGNPELHFAHPPRRGRAR